MQSEHENDYAAEYEFSNGWGASVVSNPISYGGDRGLFEVAVLDKNGDMCYTTPITDDVIGYCTHEDVARILMQIVNLDPPKESMN